jgi:acetolactate decarboxylase
MNATPASLSTQLARAPRHEVFQTGLMGALLDGIYDGDCTIEHLLTRGDFGVGTFNALDGEMVILDGVCYRLSSDGSVGPTAAHEKTPFAVATEFVAHASVTLDQSLSRAQIAEVLDDLTPSDNYLYAFRVRAEFDFVRTRTVAKQSRPYRRLVEVTKGEPVQIFESSREGGALTGDVVGFLTPVYQQGIGIAGDHAHFISSNRDQGGHVLDYQIRSGVLEVCIGTDLHLELPRTVEFENADLDDDPTERDAEVSATENHG